MQKSCRQCQSVFEVTEDDLLFYEKISPVFNDKKELIPPPTLCPPCRMQRRQAFRNERSFYQRKCDLTGKDIIALYAPDPKGVPFGEKPYTVYNQEDWWGDQWDPLQYGRSFDFSRPFFEQFAELWREVPLLSLWNIKCENSTYGTNCYGLKNCYMCINSDNGQNNLYGYVCEFSNDCSDCMFLHKSELCYACLDCISAYECTFSEQLENCQDCHFSSDLAGCAKCFGCHGLRHKTLHMFNQAVSQEEWSERMQSLVLTPQIFETMREHSDQIRLQMPHLCAKIIQCENATGDHLYRCRNAHQCFDVTEAENTKYVTYAPWKVVNGQDAYACGELEWVYEFLGGAVGIFNVAFTAFTANGLDHSYYCVLCLNGCSHLFGCIGLKHREYCILNTQYTKEEYEALVPKIIEHMRRTSEWGEFFTPIISPFAYNETVAQQEFPLSKDEALKRGLRWRDPEQKDYQAQTCDIPENIADVPDTITKELLTCTCTAHACHPEPAEGSPCRKNYRIIPQELRFYRKMELPIPRKCPDCRHRERLKLRNPRKLFARACAKCGKEMQTTYAPERPEIVYCEDCYLAAVY